MLFIDKLLRGFGRKLLAALNPVTNRVHADFMTAGAKSGRLTCSDPNLQQLPQDARHAIVAPPGKVLVVADYSQIELRVIAELADELVMRQAFQDGADLHRLTAAAVAGVPLEAVTAEQRTGAKAINFGAIYGQGSKGLVATAWSNYRIDLPLAEADRARTAFFGRYPALRPWQHRMADASQATGVVRTVLGRPLRAEWEHGGRIRYTTACNYPVQGSAADVMLLAMARAPAGLVLQVHDELVLECAEDEADSAAGQLMEAMVSAFAEMFPAAPVNGLVDLRIGKSWAKPSVPEAGASIL